MALGNTSILSHNYHFLLMVKTFKISSLTNFQVYNTVLSAIITMLYVRSPELINLITECLYPLIQYLPISLHPPALGNHGSTLCSSEFSFFRFHI